MQSKAKTVAAYLAEMPADRRESIEAVRKVILKNLDNGYEEGMQYGMIGYYVPHGVYPPGYHCDPRQPLPFVALASQKNYMSLYMMCLYADAAPGGHEPGNAHARWFADAWERSGKKLDCGKSCIRFKRAEDLALDVIGEAVRRMPVKEHIRTYEAAIETPRPARPKRSAAKKTVKTIAKPKKRTARRPEAKR